MTKSARLLAVTAALLALTSCSDDATAPRTDPDGDPPAAFTVEIPATVTQGQAFPLTVTALDEAGHPETTWRGTATLTASAGTLSPASVELVNGTATVQVTLTGHAGDVTVRAVSGNVQSDAMSTTVLSGQAPARLEIVPAAALLTGAGATQQFTVRAYDAQGAPTPATQVTWTSNDNATLAIDASGLATAQAAVGSAMITASANGVTSEPAVVLVAEPAANAVLISDEQIVSGIEPVDPAAEYEPGWQYRVRVTGVAPEVGDVVIGTGAQPLAGRVVQTSDVAGELELTVELLALNQLFTELHIDESIPMVERTDGLGPQSRMRGQGTGLPRHFATAETEFSLGRFKCTADGSLPSLDLPSPTLDIDPDLYLQIGYTNGLERLAVAGTVTADAGYRPVFEATFTGAATCETVVKTFTVPTTGIISLFYGVQVPLGFGFTLDGQVDVAQVGFDISANATATVELGVTCPGGGACSGLDTFDMTRDGSLEFIAPDPSEQFRVQLGAHAFVFARPFLGSLFTDALSFEFVDATVGLKQTVDLATTYYQVEDTAYASSFDLQFLGSIGAGKDLVSAIQKLGRLLGVDLGASFDLVEIDDTLATSPKGTFTITPESVLPGDTTELGEMATFTVELDPVDYVGMYAVDKVEFFWMHEDSTGFTLGPGRPSCVEVAGSSGKATFECETDFLEEHQGEQTFHAFVHAELFGVPLPLPLEIALNARARVMVGGCSGYPYPNQLTLRIDTTSDGRGSSYTYAASPHTYGDVGAALTAESSEGEYGTPRFTLSVQALDGVCMIPQDAEQVGDTILLRVKLNGRVAVDPPDNAWGSSVATARFRAGTTTWSADVMAQLHEDPITIDEIIDVPYALGSWTYLYPEAYVWAGSSNGVSHGASARLTYEVLGAFDAAGNAVPIKEWITQSGHPYGLQVP